MGKRNSNFYRAQKYIAGCYCYYGPGTGYGTWWNGNPYFEDSLDALAYYLGAVFDAQGGK